MELMAPGMTTASQPDRRPHILFVVASLAYGGAERHLVTLLNNLDSTEFKFSLAYLKSHDDLLLQIEHAKLEGRIFCFDVKKGVCYSAVRHLANVIDDHDVALVVAVNCYAFMYALLARWRSVRRPLAMEIFHSTAMPGAAEDRRMWIYRHLMRQCDILVYVCDAQRSYWRRRSMSPRRDMVIHNGIDIDRYADRWRIEEKEAMRRRLGFGSGDFVIGLCAALRPEKAHVDLLDALASMPPMLGKIKCLLIGDGPERPNIERRLVQLQLEGRVTITGYMEDVRPAIACCDAMTLVSRTEAFSLAVLESMALGKAMVLTSVGGAAEQIEEGVEGFLVPPGDPERLADRIAALYFSGLAGKMGERARKKVKRRFSHLAMIAAYQDLFRTLTARSPVLTEIECHGSSQA